MKAITWLYCPGHAGVRGNEVADKLAGQAESGGNIRLDKAKVLHLLADRLRNEEEEEKY